MVQAVSKNKLADWYRNTAIQHIRPVDLEEQTSKRYWEKWDRVCEADLQKFAQTFFKRIWQVESTSADCLLFDTTNSYTYMAGHTNPKLAMRAKVRTERRTGLRLSAAGIKRTAVEVMEDMSHLHYILSLKKGDRKPSRRLETPSKTQAEALSVFGYRVNDSGVLQPNNL
jgi:hypothetical protein